MKRRSRVILVAGIPLVALFVVFVVYVLDARQARRTTVLPDPNGYDDFAIAARSLVNWTGDLPKMSPEGMRDAVSQNAKVLEAIRTGLKKECAVPVVADMNWFSSVHMAQIMAQKRMAQLLVAEGLVHLENGRTNEAARSFSDCIRFAHAAHRQGLMMDQLVGIACQAIGTRRLIEVAPQLPAETIRAILTDLIALDQARESAQAIMDRDKDWAHATHGTLRMAWGRIAERLSHRTMEASFEKSVARSVAALRLSITELAVRGSFAERGKLPASLAELVPGWLPSALLDPFSQRPLVYRVTTNSFLLYSVGPDGKDDQGTPLKRGKTELGDLLPSTL